MHKSRNICLRSRHCAVDGNLRGETDLLLYSRSNNKSLKTTTVEKAHRLDMGLNAVKNLLDEDME